MPQPFIVLRIGIIACDAFDTIAQIEPIGSRPLGTQLPSRRGDALCFAVERAGSTEKTHIPPRLEAKLCFRNGFRRTRCKLRITEIPLAPEFHHIFTVDFAVALAAMTVFQTEKSLAQTFAK